MRFEHPWFLLLLAPLALWSWHAWYSGARGWRLFVKLLSLSLLVVALASPSLPVWDPKLSVVVLVDTSRSIPQGDLERAGELVRALEHHRGRHELRVLPFARSPRQPAPEELQSGRFLYSPAREGYATNLEDAIREAIAALPARRVPRIVLISDGQETEGSVLRAITLARALDIPIDVYPLHGRPEPSLRIERLALPALLYAGEPFPVELELRAQRQVTAQLRLEAENQVLGQTLALLQRGLTRLRLRVVLDKGGTYELKGTLEVPGELPVGFAQAIRVRQPSVLLVTQDPPAAVEHFVSALERSHFLVQPSQQIPVNRLTGYDLVVLNNWDLQATPTEAKQALERYTSQGGGLLVIAGENNVYLRERQQENDPLERVLPARLVPPKSPEGTCVVLVLDKSSSMEGRKIELAKLAAIGVVDQLRPEDRVGVLIFDNSFQWAVPIRRAQEKSLINRLISGIVADGGTQIAPALEEAFRRIQPVRATYRHIVLLTDGISEEGNSMAVAQQAAAEKVTISTVGLGEDVNKAYLQKVAELARGKCYLVRDASELARILLKDVLEHTGSTVVQEVVRAAVVQPAGWLGDIDWQNAPPLSGYVRFEAKPTADLLLRAGEKDPLLVRWQYGLGRAAVFTSDAKGFWATDWLSWRGFDHFWTSLVRDLLPRSSQTEPALLYDRADRRLRVVYQLAEGVAEPRKLPVLYLVGPDGTRRTVTLEKVAPQRYEALVPLENRAGFYRLRPLEDDPLFPEVGFYQPESEMETFGANGKLLQQIASYTGGQWEPSPAEVFNPQGRAASSTLVLWPGLLLLALMLNLLEVWLRKWRVVRQALEHLEPAWSTPLRAWRRLRRAA